MMLDRLALRCAWYGVLSPASALPIPPPRQIPTIRQFPPWFGASALTQILAIVLGLPPLLFLG